MKNLFVKFVTGFSILSVVFWSGGAAALANQSLDDNLEKISKKVTICHQTSSDSNEFVEIEVAAESVVNHIEHGDHEGSCPDPDPEPVVNHGEWCSALLGMAGSSTLRNNQVINANDDGAFDLSDISMITEWYTNGNNDACYSRFEPSEGNLNFNEDNYLEIDWCAGLFQGLRDTIGSQRGETNFSEIFDLNNDGKINLTDTSIVARYIYDNDQTTCYTHYNFPAWPEEPEPTVPGDWCSVLHGVVADAIATETYSEVADLNHDEAVNLSDVALMSEWYANGNIDACRSQFYIETAQQPNFNEENYTDINWCQGFLQGLRDSLGGQTGDPRYSAFFDLNDDGVINLTDIVLATPNINANNPAVCYLYFVPPFPAWGGETDVIAPVITLLGENPINVYINSTYTDAGATASDNVDGDISAYIVTTGTVNTSTIGTYTLTYNVSDKAGNDATPVTRTVNVIALPDGPDITAPIITLLGENPVNVTVGNTYTDAGATASDNIDGDITSEIVLSGTVNTNVIGTYTLTYNVSDNAGNPATPVTRTVNVIAQNNNGGGGGGGGYAGGGGGGIPEINFFNIQTLVGTTTATITWETTRSSLTWMLYGTSSPAYGQEVKNNSYHATHTVSLTNLLPNTTYHYQLRASDSNLNTNYDIDRIFTTGNNGLPQQILGIKELACVPDIDGDMKDISQFANGVLLRGCGPEVYHIIDGKKFHIPNWQYLHDNYFSIRIYNIADSNLVQFPDTNTDNVNLKKILSKVAGAKVYANGSLLRAPDKKVYVILNGKKSHVKTLEELKKYAGRKIFEVSEDILSQY